MSFSSLRAFISALERENTLKRITLPVSTHLEMTEIQRRFLRQRGPALVFESPAGKDGTPAGMPVVSNIFATQARIAFSLGKTPEEFGKMGETLAFLRQPEVPADFSQMRQMAPMLGPVMAMRPKTVNRAPCQEICHEGEEVDLSALPVQTCWPGEPAPLITWGVVVTAPPGEDTKDVADETNLGVYRMQVTGPRTTIMRWLAHRGGARHLRSWREEHGEAPMPVAVVIGADPATLLAAVTPVPEALSEYAFAGLLRGERTALVPCRTVPLKVPAEAEIVLEGHILPETAMEGPYGDHTGYMNAPAPYPVFRLSAITRRKDAMYLSTHTGRPPDEPSRLGEALNTLFTPLLKQQFPEIVDFHLPPEACSYRMAVVSIRKEYPGHARRVMMGLWSFLPQFLYTKMIVVVDPDINVKSWTDVIWALSTRMDPARDAMILSDTPVDILDFATQKPGLGGKMGLDATWKAGYETDRPWGATLSMPETVRTSVDRILARKEKT